MTMICLLGSGRGNSDLIGYVKFHFEGWVHQQQAMY